MEKSGCLEIAIDFKRNLVLKKVTTVFNLFTRGRFILEDDSQGFSCIESREDGFYLVNRRRLPGIPSVSRILSSKKIPKEEARDIIKAYTLRHD